MIQKFLNIVESLCKAFASLAIGVLVLLTCASLAIVFLIVLLSGAVIDNVTKAVVRSISPEGLK